MSLGALVVVAATLRGLMGKFFQSTSTMMIDVPSKVQRSTSIISAIH